MVSIIKNVNGCFANIYHGHLTFADISNHDFNYMNMDHVLLLANGYTEGIKMIGEVLNQSSGLKSKYTQGHLIPEFLENARKVAMDIIRLFDGSDSSALESFIKALGNFNKQFNQGEDLLEEIWKLLEDHSNERQI